MNLNNYFLKSLNHIKEDCGTQYEDFIVIGEKTAKLTTFSNELRNIFFSSLEHLKVISNEEIDLQLYYVSDDSLKKPFQAPDWGNIEFDAQGYSSELEQNEISVFFQPWLRQIFMYSYKDKIGIYWVKSIEEIPWWESTFSFRTIFHMWTRDTPLQLMHAGAISTKEGKSFLLPAQSGSGKSTTTCTLFEEGYLYLGDDYVLVDTDKNIVYKMYGTTKMEWENLETRFPHLLSKTINLKERPNQKGVLYLESHTKSINSAKIYAILVPELDTINSGISKASVVRSLMAIAPTTLHHLPHNRNQSYAKITKLVNSLHNYKWKLDADRKKLIQQFEKFHNEANC